MSRSSGEPGAGGADARAQLEPVPAVVAGLVVTAALATYVGALDEALDRYGPERDLATRALDAVGDHLRQDGAAIPSRLRTADSVAPSGRRLNATLASADGRWGVGPPVPDPTAQAVDRARRRIAVRHAPGRVRTGWLEVTVW